MSGFRKRFLIVLSLLLLTGIYLSIYTFASPDAPNVDISDIPLHLGEWKGRDIAMDETVFEILETDSLIMREYRNDKNEAVWFVVVYYGDSRVGFHRPEACLAGRGSFLINRGIEEIIVEQKEPLTIVVNKLQVGSSTGDKMMLYFYAAGKQMTGNYHRFRLHMILKQIRYRQSSGALVRFSTIIENGDTKKALAIVKKFAQKIVPVLPDYLL